VYHDLRQSHQGHEQPGHLSLARRAWPWIFGALVMLSVASGLFARGARQPVTARGPILLVSGRDDHGLLAQPTIALTSAPRAESRVAQISDGTLVRVLEERGEWLRVQAIASPQPAGWINSYHLRSRALWQERGTQVTFVDARMRGDQVEVWVRPIDNSHGPAWVAASRLHEIGAQDQHTDHRH
jgi:hypothetical protein